MLGNWRITHQGFLVIVQSRYFTIRQSLLIKIHTTSDSVYHSSTSNFSCSTRSVLISEINSMSDFRNSQIDENENSVTQQNF
ncbi:hypothetical protein JHK87_027931 [Glycine soja]|nr:hypothetical protein JHK87_027931 [Glycine soja]